MTPRPLRSTRTVPLFPNTPRFRSVINSFGKRAEIEKTRSRLEDGFGIRAVYSAADMSRPEDVRSLVAEAEEAFGRVDVLVNNAGIQHTAPVEDFPAEKWDAVIAINLSAAFHAVQAALPGMRRRGWGRLINTASAHGQERKRVG